MKFYRLLFPVVLLISLFSVSATASAHAGKTDSNGGHWDYSTGTYHYHHGYSAHSHYDIDGDSILDCPYDFDDKTGLTSSNSTGASSLSRSLSEEYQAGYKVGFDDGYGEGMTDGYNSGLDDGKKTGDLSGYQRGKSEGYQSGKTAGLQELEAAVSSAYHDSSWRTLLVSIFCICPILFFFNNRSHRRYQAEQFSKYQNQIDTLSSNLSSEKKRCTELEQFKEKYDKLLLHEEKLRNQINISTLGALSKTTSASNFPKDVTLMPSCIPVKGLIDTKHPYGEYTVFTNPSSKCYHRKYGCCGASTPVHYFRLNPSYSPCQICARSDPRQKLLPDWYIDIKKNVTQSNCSNGLPPQKNETYYLIEANDGMLMRVPESRLDAWTEAQSNPSRPLTDAEKQLRERIKKDLVKRIYGDSKDD